VIRLRNRGLFASSDSDLSVFLIVYMSVVGTT
jgi:hypothetical protein